MVDLPLKDDFKKFQILFNDLKNLSNNNPESIETFYSQHEEMQKAVDDLYSLLRTHRFEKKLLFYSGKVTNARTSFIDDWKDYEKRWKEIVTTVRFSQFDFPEFLIDDADLTAIQEEASGKKRRTLEEEYEFHAWKPDIEYDEEFDPAEHDGAASVELGLNVLHGIVDYEFHSRDSPEYMGVEAKIGLEALEYLQSDIGLEFKSVFRRWFLIPKMFIPPKVSNKHGGDSRKFTLYDQLDNAMKSFVFGADLASIAMCRAVLEQVLKMYLPGNEDTPLGKLVSHADAKFDFIQKGKINPFREKSNKILHDPSGSNIDPDDVERLILDFLKTLKFLIERLK